MALTNFRVVVCKIVTCVSAFTEMVIICPSECGRGFSLKLFVLRLQRAARYVRHATVGAYHRTSNRQEHKIIQRAGPEQDTIFHFNTRHSVQTARQPRSRRAISLGSFTGTGDFVLQLIRLKSLGSELQDSKQLSSCG